MSCVGRTHTLCVRNLERTPCVCAVEFGQIPLRLTPDFSTTKAATLAKADVGSFLQTQSSLCGRLCAQFVDRSGCSDARKSRHKGRPFALTAAVNADVAPVQLNQLTHQ